MPFADMLAGPFQTLAPDRYALAYGWLPLWLQYGAAIALGLVIGSFLTVVVHRLPVMLLRSWSQAGDDPATNNEASAHRASALPGDTIPATRDGLAPAARYNLALPPSSCPQCGHRLRWFENVPLLGYIWLRGRCAACGAGIPARYPAIEASSALLAALAVARFGPGAHALAAYGCAAVLLTLAFIDAETRLLPDDLTLPLLWAGLLVNLGATFTPLRDAVLGAALGYATLWLLYWAFRLLRGKEGIGYGDFKLLAALGACLGAPALLQIVLCSSVAGVIWGVAAMLRGRLADDRSMPFGPFLAAGGLITLYGGDLVSYWIYRA
jgi:leader peptidase (prepilin peptidase)/N-methyltransferase